MTVVHVAVFGLEIYVNGGFQKMSENPLFGFKQSTLLEFGAKYGPYITAKVRSNTYTHTFL